MKLSLRPLFKSDRRLKTLSLDERKEVRLYIQITHLSVIKKMQDIFWQFYDPSPWDILFEKKLFLRFYHFIIGFEL